MTLDTFFNSFDLISDIPNAVSQIRELLRRLAVQGRLVPQDPSDQSATYLAEAIGRDRLNHLKLNGATRKLSIDTFSIATHASPLPSTWTTVRLGHLCRAQAGFAFNSAAFVQSESGIPIIRIRDITSSRTQVNYVGEYREEFLVNEGDYLVGMDGNFTVARWLGPPAILNQRVTRLQWYSKQLEPAFIAVALQYRIAELQGTKAYTTVDHLSTKQIENAEVPLPPLAEQRRIVAKLDEVMALCDRLEEQQWEWEAQHAALSRAALDRFTEAPTPENLQFLFHPSYTISPAELRKTILTLSVQGKLVPQVAIDSDLTAVLEKNDEKRRSIAFRDRRAEAQSLELLSADCRWEVPDTWIWRALADLVLFVDYRGKTPPKASSGVRLLTAKNVRRGFINLSPEEFLAEDVYRAWMTRGFPRQGDVLFTTEAPMGFAAVVEPEEEFAVAQRVICFQGYGAVDSRFLTIQLLSDNWQSVLEQNATGMTATGIKAGKLKHLPIAVPPIAEQRRIVAKVDELMALVDGLEAQLAASRTAASALLEALVSELTTAASPAA